MNPPPSSSSALPTAALTSDHVNYLIFRYLQEAGHENTATAFYRDWHRSHEFRDPEDYPFAPVVRRNELVRVIQSGLRHDELEARVRKDERRYRFTGLPPGDGQQQQQQQQTLENGVGPASSGPASRPGSSAKDKYRPSVRRAQHDFPTPAPKRQRRSEGSEGVHLNGDAMDVDARSPSAAEPDDDVEAASPAVGSEPEMTDIPERYDSMDIGVQTDTKSGPKTSTMYWKIDKPGAMIYHSAFAPTSTSGSNSTLMTVGESLCRFYQLPANPTDTTQILNVDESTLSPNSVVTASAWHPNGYIAAFAADTLREFPDDSQIPRQHIFCHDSRNGASFHYTIPPLLEPQGIVLALRFNPRGDKLLVLRTNLKRGSILVYDTQEMKPENAHPIAWSCYEHQILDAAWLSELSYVLAGENGFSRYETVAVPGVLVMSDDATAQRSYRIDRSDSWLHERATDDTCTYDKVRASSNQTVVALASSDDRRLVIGKRPSSVPYDVALTATIGLQDHLTAMAFQPSLSDSSASNTAILAVTFESGSCGLYLCTSAGEDEVNGTSGEINKLLVLYLKSGPALALAWSPNGAFLAVAGPDLVQVWDTSALLKAQDMPMLKKHGSLGALVTWRPNHAAAGPRNGEPRAMSEPSLSWSADGESLAFAIDKDVSVDYIRLRLCISHTD